MLVNNAGIGMRTVNPRFVTDPQPFWAVTPGGFRDVIDTKVTGAFLVARAVAPRMVAAGSGRIINISMNEQTMTRRGFVPYGPSGAAVEAMSPCDGCRSGRHAGDREHAPAGGATATGMLPDDTPPETANVCSIPPSWVHRSSGWLHRAAGIHDQRIVATEFTE